MTTTNAAITANVPYPVLTALGTTNTDPTFGTLQVVQVQLNANSAYIQSDHGNGRNGHLALTTIPVDYALRSINHVTFTPPTNPPAVPAHADDATAVHIAEDNRSYAHQWHDFNDYHNADNTLHNKIIATVPTIYIAALRDPVNSFGNTTTLELLAHLYDTYGDIAEAEMDKNTNTMKDK
jgi:hypothetical protein